MPNRQAHEPGGTKRQAQSTTSMWLWMSPIWRASVALVLTVILVYSRTYSYPFIHYDDHEYIWDNLHVTGGLTAANVFWAFTSSHSSNWHPLTWLSHMLDWELYGGWSGGHHLTSAVLHAGTAVVLLVALRNLTGDLWPSAFVAAAFALHPLRVESVAWASERKDVLSGLFFALTLLAYAWYVRAPSNGRYAAVAAALSVGLMAKPMLVTTPFVLLLLDYWPLERLGPKSPGATPTRPGPRRVVVEKLPLLGLALISSVVTYLVQSSAREVGAVVSFPARLSNAAVSYVMYIVQSLYPVDLAVYYPHPEGRLPTSQVALAVAALIVVTVAVVVLRRRAPYVIVGWFWYVGMLVPVIGLVQVGVHGRADRFTYLPQIGLLIALAWGVRDWLRVPPVVLVGGAAALLSAAAVLSWRQTHYWRDTEALFTHDLSCTKPNWVAYQSIGASYLDHGRYDEAIRYFHRALELEPNPRTRLSLVLCHGNLGLRAARAGHLTDAIGYFETALGYEPGDPETRRNLAAARIDLGLRRRDEQRLEDAATEFRKAVAADPEFAVGHGYLGGALLMLGRYDEAISALRRALQLDPREVEARRLLEVAEQKVREKK